MFPAYPPTTHAHTHTHMHTLCQGLEPGAPTSSGGDETGECFGQGRRVVGNGADERNTPSQLETKERPAKGPIAQD